MIKEIKSNPLVYLLLLIILAGALFVRVYRLDQLLGFYYDQGRDALVIWKLWHEGKFFLIGPVTGLAGIFLGPFYYYLLAPFYKIGGGSPVLPAQFLGLLSTIAVFMLYYLGWKIHSRSAGIFAALIGGFSYYLVLSSRWLSNPTPLLLVSLLLVWSMWKVTTSRNNVWWVLVTFFVGLSLQFESSSAVFYLPMMLIFAIWQRKHFPSLPVLFLSIVVFFATLLPQILFNFRHDNILVQNLYKVLVEEKSFRASFWEVLPLRMDLYWNVAYTKIFPSARIFAILFFLLVGTALLNGYRALWKNPGIKIILLFLGTAMVGFLLFQGNYGNVWDYYLTGYYLPFVLLFAIGLGELWKNQAGKVLTLVFFVIFFINHSISLRNYLIAGADGPTHITLGNEVQAVDWALNDGVKRGDFNVDVYVPPVIPHSYDYLFLWRATEKCGKSLCGMNLAQQTPVLYTLYEVDPPHPERLKAWLARQVGIGVVEEKMVFGGITIERRHRLEEKTIKDKDETNK